MCNHAGGAIGRGNRAVNQQNPDVVEMERLQALDREKAVLYPRVVKEILELLEKVEDHSDRLACCYLTTAMYIRSNQQSPQDCKNSIGLSVMLIYDWIKDGKIEEIKQ